jgi:hypothetical protein
MEHAGGGDRDVTAENNHETPYPGDEVPMKSNENEEERKAEEESTLESSTETVASASAPLTRHQQQPQTDDSTTSVPTNSTNMLLMGYHAISNLDHTDLPVYAREHKTTLTFPEKVSQRTRDVTLSYPL